MGCCTSSVADRGVNTTRKSEERSKSNESGEQVKNNNLRRVPTGGLPEKILEEETPDGAARFGPRGKKLGEGGFGIVHEATDKETGEKVAVKMIKKSRILSEDDQCALRREIQIMKHLEGHPNIVKVSGAYEDGKSVYVVLELCEGGDMFNRLLKKGHYSELDAANLCRSMLEILKFCHEKNVIHRDLKPDNFLFDGPGDDAVLKATDFGLSSFFKEGEYIHKSCGTPLYIAPEVINKKYTEKADVWSIGVILYILLSGKVPFYGKTIDDMLASTLRGEVEFSNTAWSSVTDDAKNAVRKMLTYDPQLRPSAEEMLEDPWIMPNGKATTAPLLQSVFENLKQFAEMNKLKKRALQLMVANLKMSDIEQVKQAFQSADEDNSGTITVEEMKKALEKIEVRLSDKQFSEMWDVYDVDDNGEIDYVEFLTATVEMNKIQTVENMHFAFNELDQNGDGQITVDEVMAAMSDLGVNEDTAKSLLAEADRNRDGVIDYSEFVIMMTQRSELKPQQQLLNLL